MYTLTQKYHVCTFPLHHQQSVLLSLYHLGLSYVLFSTSTCIHDHSSSCLLCTWGAMTISRGKYSDFQLCVNILFLKTVISTSLFAATENSNRLSWTIQRCEGSVSASSCMCQCTQPAHAAFYRLIIHPWRQDQSNVSLIPSFRLYSYGHKKKVHFFPLILQPFCTQDSASVGKGRAGVQRQLWALEEQSAA